MVANLLDGCRADPVGSARSCEGTGKGEGEVDIVAWVGYIERGDNDKNYD